MTPARFRIWTPVSSTCSCSPKVHEPHTSYPGQWAAAAGRELMWVGAEPKGWVKVYPTPNSSFEAPLDHRTLL